MPEFPGQTDLAAALKLLSSRGEAVALLSKFIDDKDITDALSAMKEGALDDGIGADVHDFFLDAINNDSVEACAGVILSRLGEEVSSYIIHSFHGIFTIEWPERDRLGYFLSLDAAKQANEFNWFGNQVIEGG